MSIVFKNTQKDKNSFENVRRAKARTRHESSNLYMSHDLETRGHKYLHLNSFLSVYVKH